MVEPDLQDHLDGLANQIEQLEARLNNQQTRWMGLKDNQERILGLLDSVKYRVTSLEQRLDRLERQVARIS